MTLSSTYLRTSAIITLISSFVGIVVLDPVLTGVAAKLFVASLKAVTRLLT